MKFNIFISIVLILFTISSAQLDSTTNNLILKISGDSIWNNVDTLTTFERATKNPEAIESSNFIESYLNTFNYDIVESQTYASGHTPNIFAVKKGETFPNEYYLIGAHYDSYQSGAEAADDNGSGVGALMEIVRVFDQYKFDRSIILIFYSGEEIGLKGSKFFADSSVNNNVNIISIINLDVIGYLHPGSPFDFDCSYNTASINMYYDFKDLVNTYIPEVSIVDASSKIFASSSDHSSFWDNNIKGLFLAEELNPYGAYFNNNWHTTDDKLGNSANSKELMEVVARSAALYTACQATIYKDPVELTDFTFGKEIESGFSIVKASQGNLIINYKITSNVGIKIFNSAGKCLKRTSQYLTNGINEISLSNNYSKGYYILEIVDKNIKIKKPFVIN